VLQDIRDLLGALPGSVYISQPLTHRINFVMTGLPSQLAIKIYGDDLSTLAKLAEELRARLTHVPGLTDLKVEAQARIPQLRIRIDPDAARIYGVTPAQLPRFLGAMTWELLRREVGDWRRFSNRRQVASYTGLCPSEHSSGCSRLQGSITRHGNPRIRHLLVEAAWRLVRNQPGYHAVAKWREALLTTAAGPARRKKIIVAIARQLAIDLWRLATGRSTAQQLGFATA
jgi:transposase